MESNAILELLPLHSSVVLVLVLVSEQWGLLIMSVLAKVEDCQCQLNRALGQRDACHAVCYIFARLNLQPCTACFVSV